MEFDSHGLPKMDNLEINWASTNKAIDKFASDDKKYWLHKTVKNGKVCLEAKEVTNVMRKAAQVSSDWSLKEVARFLLTTHVPVNKSFYTKFLSTVEKYNQSAGEKNRVPESVIQSITAQSENIDWVKTFKAIHDYTVSEKEIWLHKTIKNGKVCLEAKAVTNIMRKQEAISDEWSLRNIANFVVQSKIPLPQAFFDKFIKDIEKYNAKQPDNKKISNDVVGLLNEIQKAVPSASADSIVKEIRIVDHLSAERMEQFRLFLADQPKPLSVELEKAKHILDRYDQLKDVAFEIVPLSAKEKLHLALYIEDQLPKVQQEGKKLLALASETHARDVLITKSRNIFVMPKSEIAAFSAEGASKKVYSAVQLPLERSAAPVALVHAQISTIGETTRKYTEHELQFYKELKNVPGIAQMHTVCGIGTEKITNMRPFFERFDGDLNHLLKKEKNIPVAEKLHIAAQLLKALAELHQRNIIHADLKPGNVLCRKEFGNTYTAAITDFGNSFHGNSTYPNELPEDAIEAAHPISWGVYSTTIYTAPELYGQMGFSGDFAKLDTWALGSALYNLVASPDEVPWEDLQKILDQQGAKEDNEQIPSLDFGGYEEVWMKQIKDDKGKEKKLKDLSAVEYGELFLGQVNTFAPNAIKVLQEKGISTVEDEMKFVVLQMLHPDPQSRISADQAFKEIDQLLSKGDQESYLQIQKESEPILRDLKSREVAGISQEVLEKCLATCKNPGNHREFVEARLQFQDIQRMWKRS